MGEWLVVALIYLGLAVLAVLAWLASFAIFGTAITAGLDRVARLWRRDRGTAPVSDDDPDTTDATETDRLRSMLRTD